MLWFALHSEARTSGKTNSGLQTGTPAAVWEKAELTEMETVIPLYGKTFHMWQVDRGDSVPMGMPQLMGSFRSEEDVKKACPGGLKQLADMTRNRFGVDIEKKREQRKDLKPDWKKHPDADGFWKD